MSEKKISFLKDTMGLYPLPLRLKQAIVAIKGEEDVPRSKFGFSSLSQLHLLVGHKLWRGKPYINNKVIITNLFNHTPTPIEEGWSTKVTKVRDFRGKRLTYNSHNGTDFAIPVGSLVCTAAPGSVVAILSEFNRGGLKIFIDHGSGLITCYAHLAKSLVKVGDNLNRGQTIAISGYSGLDGVITFPFGMPHIHFNVWLNGLPVDPFAYGVNPSMWYAGELPAPVVGESLQTNASNYSTEKLNEVINSCKTNSVREKLNSIKDINERAVFTIIEMNYYPTRFALRQNVYDKTYPRTPQLDLPFSKNHFNGVVFLDEVLPSLILKEKFASQQIS